MLRARPYLLFVALIAAPISSCQGQTTAPQGTPQAAATPATAQAPKVAPAARSPSSGDMMENCDSLPITDKEACYARQAPDLVDECERMRLHSCAPYAKVHDLEQQLKQLNVDLLQAASKSYASYEDSQPGYVKDVEQFFTDTDRTWRAYRDAHCNLEPFIQGMSRIEAADLTEACRADKTAERIKELKDVMSTLFQGGSNR